MDNTALANALNTYTLYSFAKAFAKSGNPKLQRVYVTKVPNGTNFASLAQRADVEKTSLVSEENVLAIDANSSFSPLPSDYNDLITGGRNTALDLIKAPLAWSITTSDPNVVVGMSDGNIVLSHEDLLDSNIDYTSVGNHNGFHGTAMAGLFNAATNNNATGIASVAPDASLAFVETSGGLFSLTQGLIELIDLKNTIHPNLKIINCSWASTSNPTYLQDVMYGPDGIVENDILLIASAGNSNNEVYHYPASYPETMSITSVGHRVQIGEFHNIERDTLGNFFPEESWIDCFPFRPEVSSAGHVRNDRISVTAPGHLLTGLNDNMSPNDSGHPTGYWIFSATSPVAPIVSGVAALVQSVNPNLSAPQIKQLLEDTADDIYYIPYNQPYTGLLGTGRINAYRAVKTADCMANPVAGLDLAMQNSLVDYFFEPDTETEHVFTSKDIFVRNQNDGQLIKKHQNPEYDANAPNYVYIRVTNNSCETSAGNENLKLYWAKADTSLNWPEHWDGSLTMTDPTTSAPIIMGNQIGTLPIPVLEPGQSKLVEFAWNVPNPDDYTNINPNPWHFCLLARIDTPTDPMTVPETSSLYHNVVNNNNIVWKNTTVVDILPESPSDVTSVVSVGNSLNVVKKYDLEFRVSPDEGGKRLYREAEITIEMDQTLFDAWDRGGRKGTQLKATKDPKKYIVLDNSTALEDISLAGNERGTLSLSFNFLTKELTDKVKHLYYATQKDAVTGAVIGGEEYEIKESFSADAGSDKEIERDESVTITAAQINNAAEYNWYDSQGNLVYTGRELTVSPEVTKTYRLEIITDDDGYKDYDEVEVKVNPYSIGNIAPNPTSNQAIINYVADQATSAYLMVVSTVTGISNNYILDTAQTSIAIDVSNYPTGTYTVALVCDGDIEASKNLFKQ